MSPKFSSSSSSNSSRRIASSGSPHQRGSMLRLLLRSSCMSFCFPIRCRRFSVDRLRSSILPPVHPCSRIASSSNNATSSRPGSVVLAVTISRAVKLRRVKDNGEHPCVRRWDTSVGGATNAAWCREFHPAERNAIQDTLQVSQNRYYSP